MNIFTQPDNPIIGDLWYDKITNVLTVYDGKDWIVANNENLNQYRVKPEYPYRGFSDFANTIISEIPPEESEQGDLWYEPTHSITYIFNENEWIEL